jgi:hypothetical protein
MADLFRIMADGTVWPAPGERMGEVEWSLRYRYMGEPEKSLPEDMAAASIISAYRELIRLPQRERNARIRELRKGPGRAATGTTSKSAKETP